MFNIKPSTQVKLIIGAIIATIVTIVSINLAYAEVTNTFWNKLGSGSNIYTNVAGSQSGQATIHIGDCVIEPAGTPCFSSGPSVASIGTTYPIVNTGTATDPIIGIDETSPLDVYSVSSSVIAGLTYNNGALGVGATLTKATTCTQAELGLGSAPIIVGETYLLRAVTAAWRGPYVLTSNTGSCLLTRSPLADTSSELYPLSIGPVAAGTSANTEWIQTVQFPVVGTTGLSFISKAALPYVSQEATGTQVTGQIPTWNAVTRQLKKGTSAFTWDGSLFNLFSNLGGGSSSQYLKNSGNLFNTGSSGIGSMVANTSTWTPGTSIGGTSYVHNDGAYMGASNTVASSKLKLDNDGNFQLQGEKSGVNQTWGVVTDAANLGAQIQSNNNGSISYVEAFADGIAIETPEIMTVKLQSFSSGALRFGQTLGIRDPNFAVAEFDYPSKFDRQVFDISADYNMDSTLDNVDNGIFITTNSMGSAITINLPANPVNGYTVTIGYTNNSGEVLRIQDPNGNRILSNNIEGREFTATQTGFVTMTWNRGTDQWIVQTQTGFWKMYDAETYVSPIASRMIFSSPSQLFGFTPTLAVDRFASINGGNQAFFSSRISQETVFEPGVISKAYVNIPENTLSVGGRIDLEVNGTAVAQFDIQPGVTGLLYATNVLTTSTFLEIPLTTSDLVVWRTQLGIQTGRITIPSINTEYYLK